MEGTVPSSGLCASRSSLSLRSGNCHRLGSRLAAAPKTLGPFVHRGISLSGAPPRTHPPPRTVVTRLGGAQLFLDRLQVTSRTRISPGRALLPLSRGGPVDIHARASRWLPCERAQGAALQVRRCRAIGVANLAVRLASPAPTASLACFGKRARGSISKRVCLVSAAMSHIVPATVPATTGTWSLNNYGNI
ncbi:hypothetical protein MRX96_054550 [Rhipicephalus microplus]